MFVHQPLLRLPAGRMHVDLVHSASTSCSQLSCHNVCNIVYAVCTVMYGVWVAVLLVKLERQSVNYHALPVTYHALPVTDHALTASTSILAVCKVVLAAYLDNAGQHFDGPICEVAPTQVQLYNGLIVAQALTQNLHASEIYRHLHTQFWVSCPADHLSANTQYTFENF